jgi:pimeloyl-ACP methyl ester carboxylesterase
MSNSDLNTQSGMVYTPKMLETIYNTLYGSNTDADKFKTHFSQQIFTTKFQKNHPEIVNKLLDGTFKFNNNVLGDILVDDVNMNNISLILESKMISKPTLLIGGELSIINYKTIREQGKYYKYPTIYIFKGEGSSHSMFIEKYSEFNKVFNNFLNNKNSHGSKKRSYNSSSKKRSRRRFSN